MDVDIKDVFEGYASATGIIREAKVDLWLTKIAN